MTVPLPPKNRPLLRRYARQPWTRAARRSPALRRWCDRHGYITPHFSWRSYACVDGTRVPLGLRDNARRLHFALERLRHELGDQAIHVDGPYRTPKRNREVGGAQMSRHVQADGADLFKEQVDRLAQGIRRPGEDLADARMRVVRIAERIFTGVGNEGSGTLHVDTRPGPKARFVTWRRAR